jgi:hypothetical protein
VKLQSREELSRPFRETSCRGGIDRTEFRSDQLFPWLCHRMITEGPNRVDRVYFVEPFLSKEHLDHFQASASASESPGVANNFLFRKLWRFHLSVIGRFIMRPVPLATPLCVDRYASTSYEWHSRRPKSKSTDLFSSRQGSKRGHSGRVEDAVLRSPE